MNTWCSECTYKLATTDANHSHWNQSAVGYKAIYKAPVLQVTGEPRWSAEQIWFLSCISQGQCYKLQTPLLKNSCLPKKHLDDPKTPAKDKILWTDECQSSSTKWALKKTCNSSSEWFRRNQMAEVKKYFINALIWVLYVLNHFCLS